MSNPHSDETTGPMPPGRNRTDGSADAVTLPPSQASKDQAATLLPESKVEKPSDLVSLPGYELLGELGRGGMLSHALKIAPADDPELDSTVRLSLSAWRSRFGELKREFPKQPGPAVVAVSPDGRVALLGSSGSATRLWDVPQPLRGSTDRVALWTEVLTRKRLRDDGVMEELTFPDWLSVYQRLQALDAQEGLSQ